MGFIYFPKCFFEFIHGMEISEIDVPFDAVYDIDAFNLLKKVRCIDTVYIEIDCYYVSFKIDKRGH